MVSWGHESDPRAAKSVHSLEFVGTYGSIKASLEVAGPSGTFSTEGTWSDRTLTLPRWHSHPEKTLTRPTTSSCGQIASGRQISEVGIVIALRGPEGVFLFPLESTGTIFGDALQAPCPPSPTGIEET